MNGLLLIDKPKGWTSFDVVAKIRGILTRSQSKEQATDNRQQITASRKVKVGHTGTLDPLATGLLVLTIGSYCKRASEFSKLDKTYEVTMRLGMTSTTADEEGIKAKSTEQRVVSREEVEAALQRFIGDIEQVPPAYSAIKIGGQRAYKLARAGKEVKLEPRKVTIYDITGAGYDYPFLKFVTKVSSGTYVRSLVVDIGEKIGTGAYMTDLRRTEVGDFSLQNALQVEKDDLNEIAVRMIELDKPFSK